MISLNPKFVKAYCLLALCYFKEEQIDKSRKILHKVFLIDKSNYVARKYLDSLNNDVPSAVDFVEESTVDNGGFNGPVLGGKKLNVSNAMFQFVAVLIGVGIGLSVMMFLVMPSRIEEKEQEKVLVQGQLSDMEAIKSELDATIVSLQKDIVDSNESNSGLKKDISDKQSQMREISELVNAFEYYVINDLTGAADILFDIDRELLGDDIAIVYDNLTFELYPKVAFESWENGYNEYRARRYESGIEYLEVAYKYEKNDYYSDETLYFLARCYYKLEQNDKALTIFEKLLEEYPDASNKADAQYFVNILSE